MILLSNAPRFLLPVSEREWREPSQAMPRDQMGNPVAMMRFRIRAKTHDGVVLWTGWFEDRADFDVFLWAIFMGKLQQERALWDLPSPMWPSLDPGLLYDFATVVFLTSTTATSWNVPSDWNNENNVLEGIGGAGNGSNSTLRGGGGGAYAKITNQTYAAASSVTYKAGTANGTPGTGTATANTYIYNNASTLILVAAGGANGAGGGTLGSAAGGPASYCVGTIKYAGGTGGSVSLDAVGAGGGGAAGPNGAGRSGSGRTGGSGNNAQPGGGAGGAAYVAGGNGTYWQISPAYGPGGGGGGTAAGGNYGAGGGGGNSPRVGRQGLLVITYEPVRAGGLNMPMLGM